MVRKFVYEQTFKFNSTEYKCLLEVTYTPESTLTKEKYEYTLLDITDTELETQTEIIPEN